VVLATRSSLSLSLARMLFLPPWHMLTHYFLKIKHSKDGGGSAGGTRAGASGNGQGVSHER